MPIAASPITAASCVHTLVVVVGIPYYTTSLQHYSITYWYYYYLHEVLINLVIGRLQYEPLMHPAVCPWTTSRHSFTP